MLRASALARQAAQWHLIEYLAVGIGASQLAVAAAWATKQIIDGLSRREPAGQLALPAAALITTALIAALAPEALRYLNAEIDRRVTYLANAKLYAAVNRFVGLRPFEDPKFLDLIQLARQAGSAAPSSLITGLISSTQGLLTIIGFIGVLALLSPVMPIIVALSAVPVLVAELALSKRRVAVSLELGHALRREMFFAGLVTDIHPAKEVRLFGVGRYFQELMAAEIRAMHAARRRLDRRQLRTQSLMAVLSAAVSGLGLLVAVGGAHAGRSTPGDVALFIVAAASVQGALAGLVSEIVQVHQATLLFRRYLEVLDAEVDLPTPTVPVTVEPLRDGIELRDVWFRYAPDQPWVLRGITMSIPRGESTAFVGHNGAGKSTIIKLLCRFYDPDKGAVLWDGVNINQMDPTELRYQLRAVFQDAVAYDLSAAVNIGVGDVAFVDDLPRVRAAASRSGAATIVEALPRGYETMLSQIFFSESDRDNPDTGITLSGGQWQSIALARALMREDPDLLILDEPSANLDPEAEYQLQQRLRRQRTRTTTVLVSHRLSTLRDSDHIAVLSGGRIVEQGTHDSLMLDGRLYAQMFALQADGYQTDPANELGPERVL